MNKDNNFGISALSRAVRLFCLLQGAVSFSGLNAAEPSPSSFVVAKRGCAAECQIVLRVAATDCERYAAREFAKFIACQTGVTLPIVSEGDQTAARLVVMKVDPSEAALGDEGFSLKVQDGELRVLAGRERGVLFGVYELLERFGGCGWYSARYSVIPELQSFEVPGALDERQVPAFKLRRTSWYDICKSSEFGLRNKIHMWEYPESMSGVATYRFDPVLDLCHTFIHILPAEKYFDEHPEYFSEVGGVRVKKETQLCLSNPDVLRIATEKVFERIRVSYPKGIRLYGVSPNDWWNACECKDCKALDDAEGSQAASLVQFVNKIAEAVEKEYPEVLIQTLVYTYTRKPPKTLRFRKNVLPCFCTIECDYAKPITKSEYEENQTVCDTLRIWGEKSNQMMVWDYATDFAHFLNLWPNVKSLGENLRFFRNNHVEAMIEQGDSHGAIGDWTMLNLYRKKVKIPPCADGR